MARIVTDPPPATRLPDGAVLGGWWHEDPAEAGRIVCDVCPRACALRPGDRAFCFVRENRDGQMVLTTYGHSTGFCIDPIEKKPLNHFYPGTSVLSFGTAGCNLGCKFCQNWSISKSREIEALSESASPEAIAQAALKLSCKSVAFTYNDPVIWAEYAIDTAKACRAAGVKTVAVTAGYITEQCRGTFYDAMDAANVDLKGFTEEFYQKLTLSHLQPVLDTLVWLKRETNVWFEITNLIIPQANDSRDELARMCDWIYDHLGPGVPVHFTAFHPDFRLRDRARTPAETLFAAYDIATRRGLNYVYVGNLANSDRQTTRCPSCRHAVIERSSYEILSYGIRNGACDRCGTKIDGRFDEQPGNWGSRRQPVRIAEFERAAGKEPQALVQLGDGSEIRQPRVEAPMKCSGAAELSIDQQAAILSAAAETLAATVTQRPVALADPALAGAAETKVLGCFVTARRDKMLRGCCGFMGPPTSVAQAVQRAAARTAGDDYRFPPISPSELPDLHLDVWLLFDLQRVTARGEARREAVVIGQYGLQVARGQSRGLLLPGVAVEHKLDEEQFLQHVCLKAGLPPHAWKEDDVELSTFAGIAIEGPMPPVARPTLQVAQRAAGLHRTAEATACSPTAPAIIPIVAGSPSHPQRPTQIRPPAVAGAFYPSDPAKLSALVDQLLRGSAVAKERYPAVMVPHAGLKYSGKVAAEVLRRVEIPSTVIVIGPKHTPLGVDWAVAPHASWSIPGATLGGDPELARQLVNAIPGLELDAAAHAREHAVEVELPLIARLSPQTKVVGVAIGPGDYNDCRRFAAGLAKVLRCQADRPLLIISSDMNHFANDAENRRLDELALACIDRLDAEGLLATCREQSISMCGVLPAVIVMETLRELNELHRAQRIAYATSGDVSGDTARVVGYAGVVLQ